MTRFVGLIRGINVGGNRKLPMVTLREVVAAAGGSDVQTYIQSGNVVFAHDSVSDEALAVSIGQGILAAVGFEPRVMVRSAAQWAAAIAANPYAVDDPTKVHVAFLDVAPDAERIDKFDRERFAPEEFAVIGREMFLNLPTGMGVSKLAPALSALKVDMTVRNWRTVLQLADLVEPG